MFMDKLSSLMNLWNGLSQIMRILCFSSKNVKNKGVFIVVDCCLLTHIYPSRDQFKHVSRQERILKVYVYTRCDIYIYIHIYIKHTSNPPMIF